MEMSLPKIRCAVCEKPVDVVWTHHDPSTNEHVISVRCHGQKDEMRVSDRQFQGKKSFDAFLEAMRRGGTAFGRPALPARRPPCPTCSGDGFLLKRKKGQRATFKTPCPACHGARRLPKPLGDRP